MQRYDLVRSLNLLGIYEDGARSTGDKVVAPCPYAPFYHSRGSDKKPSFAAFVNDSGKSGYICLSCHQQGTIRSLATELGRLDPERDVSEAVQFIEKVETESTVDEDVLEEARRKHAERYDQPETVEWDGGYSDIFESAWDHPEARDYLIRRRFSKRVVDELRILYDDIAQRIIFPVFDSQGGLYGFTGRYIGDQESQPKVRDYGELPKKHILLGEGSWVAEKPLIVVEGLFDYARMYELGVSSRYNIGAILGSELTPQKANKIVALGVPVYLMLDNDDAGRLGVYGRGKTDGAAQRLFGHVPLFVTTYPDGYKDPDDLNFIQVRDMLRGAQLIETLPARLPAPKKK